MRSKLREAIRENYTLLGHHRGSHEKVCKGNPFYDARLARHCPVVQPPQTLPPSKLEGLGSQLTRSMMYISTELKSTAYHEAGHAVIAYLLGRRFRLVTVDPDKCEEGVCDFVSYYDIRIILEILERTPAIFG